MFRQRALPSTVTSTPAGTGGGDDVYTRQDDPEPEVGDIEDIVKIAEQQHACAFFMSRDASKEADVILMPYNYLIDGELRRTLEIDLNGAIVICDEAHNVVECHLFSVHVRIASESLGYDRKDGPRRVPLVILVSWILPVPSRMWIVSCAFTVNCKIPMAAVFHKRILKSCHT